LYESTTPEKYLYENAHPGQAFVPMVQLPQKNTICLQIFLELIPSHIRLQKLGGLEQSD
jgi:hypothetical protein